MKCYFKDEFSIVVQLDLNTNYEIYEDDTLVISEYYTGEVTHTLHYKLDTNYYIKHNENTIELDYDGIYDTSLFSTYNYDKHLGVSISDKIYFTVWAPLKKQIDLIIYIENEEKTFSMIKENGVFKANIDLSYVHTFYMYKINNIYAIDPYATCVIDNKGYILSYEDTYIDSFTHLKRGIKDCSRIIYEVNVKDFTYELNNKNHFGLIEDNDNIGFNHLIELGITDIQLLPIFDYESNENYNWGYMPLNFNSLTSLYSLNEYNKIREFKQIVKKLNKYNIGVIMDVVYNHTSNDHSFDKFVPGYYYRKNNNEYCNASGCGNEIASTRFMARKYIVDSVCYWASEYKLSGFRFDLMAILDIHTINILANKLKTINNEILIYGEPWSASQPQITKEIQCNKENISNYNNIYYFNDVLRDAIKGDVFNESSTGFIQGNTYYKQIILREIKKKTINYVSCHDNHTLYDKLKLTSTSNIINKQKQANAIILLSNGISFLHSGVEFCRTKNFIDNSYNCDIEINKINWMNKEQYVECFTYYKNLISFKKKIDVNTIEEYSFDNDLILSYKINDMIIIHNSNKQNIIQLDKDYELIFHNKECSSIVNELHLDENNTYIIKELK